MLDTLLGDLIPFEHHIDDDVVLIRRTNSVMAMFAIEGVCADTADAPQIATWFDQIHNWFKNVHAEDVLLDFYACRGEAAPDVLQPGIHTNDYSRELDTDYLEHLRRQGLHENPLFMSITVCGEGVTQQKFSRFLSEAPSDPKPAIRRRRQRLDELCGLAQAQ